VLPCPVKWPRRAVAISLPVAIVSESIQDRATKLYHDATSYTRRPSKGRLKDDLLRGTLHGSLLDRDGASQNLLTDVDHLALAMSHVAS
jgi:hypothetical protein